MLTDRTAGRLRLTAALQAELAEPSSLLPSRSIEHALAGNVEAAATYLAARMSAVIRSPTTEVVVAAKSSRGFRPVHVLDIEQRVLYRALVDLLRPRIEYPDRSDDAYDQFTRAPLSIGTATHIVRADVASFYQYIDHHVLEAEIVSQTGEAQIAASISNIVGTIMARHFGLPQNTGASHALSEVYIDKVERQMFRYGQSVWRYNDDFAMAADGLRHARRSLEDLERSLRSVGLTLNDEKSIIQRRDTYQRWVDRPAELRGQLSDDLSVDLNAWILEPASGYEEEPDEEDEEEETLAVAAQHEAQIAGALRTLREWLEHVQSETSSDPLERYVHRTLARDAVRVLRRRLSSEGLAFCDSLLTYEPQMTHTVCRYLGRIATVDSGAAEFVTELAVHPDTHLSVWQKLWLLEPLLWSADLPIDLVDWVTSMLDARTSPLLQARAALVLATHGLIAATQISLLFDESTNAARPDLVIAMSRATDGNDALVDALAAENGLLRFVAAQAGNG